MILILLTYNKSHTLIYSTVTQRTKIQSKTKGIEVWRNGAIEHTRSNITKRSKNCLVLYKLKVLNKL